MFTLNFDVAYQCEIQFDIDTGTGSFIILYIAQIVIN